MKKMSKSKAIHWFCSLKKIISGLSFLILWQGGLDAQSAVSASGSDGTGPGGSVAYTIGQVTYTNLSGEDGSINLGVQQPNLFLTVGTDETEITLTASLYPNPTNTTASLRLDGKDASVIGDDLAYRIYDLSGKLLMHQRIQDDITAIPVDHLTGSVFILQVTRKDVEIKSFKIFKTN